MRESERDLRDQRTQLTAIVAQQRLATKAARASAAREADRALILAEDARDLDGLIARLDENAVRRRILSGLPGPVLRPAVLSPDTESDQATTPSPLSSPETPLAQQTGLGDFQLPVAGQTLVGFGEERASGLRSKGVQLIPDPGAQLVVPAAGRVVFAGPYEGFGRIAIIEHPAGWSSLVTGLATINVAVGDRVVIGAPLGLAGDAGSVIGIELRKDGEPVNPLDHLSN
jgi:septal ring factor EnvC (AmiA/AmiB activator)